MMQNQESCATRSPAMWCWFLALVAATLPVLFGYYQVMLFFREGFPEMYWSRTLPAGVGVLFAIAGVALPVTLLWKRAAFLQFSRSRQWAACGIVGLLVPVLYLMTLIWLIDASRRSRPLFPHTPTITMRHDPDGSPPLVFGVTGEIHGRGHNRQHNQLVEVEWDTWLEPSAPGGSGRDADGDPSVRIRSRVESLSDSIWTVTVEVESDRTAVFSSDALDILDVQLDGDPVSLPVEMQEGSHTITLHVQPT